MHEMIAWRRCLTHPAKVLSLFLTVASARRPRAHANSSSASTSECLLLNATGCWVDGAAVDSYGLKLRWRGPFENLTATRARSKLEPFCPPWCEAIDGCCGVHRGQANSMTRLSAVDAAVLGLATHGGMLRSGDCLANTAGRIDLTVQSALLAFHFGELGIAPRVHAAWLGDAGCSSHTRLSMVTEPYLRLRTLLSLSNGTRTALRGASGLTLEQQLVGHVRGIAELGCLFLDLHEDNVLVRPASYTRHHLSTGFAAPAWEGAAPWERFAAQAWESRLTDFDRQFVLPASRMDVDCTTFLMLGQLAMLLSCSENPRVAFRSEIARLAALPSVQSGRCAALFNASTGPPESLSYGTMRTLKKFEEHFHKLLLKPGLKKRSATRLDAASRMLYYGSTHCPAATLDALRLRWDSGLPPL